MIIKNCKVCNADIKLKRDVPVSLSCYKCLRREATQYQLNNPASVGYSSRLFTRLDEYLENRDKKVSN